MRTTLVIDDALMRQLRKQAAEKQETLSELVEQALREFFRRKPEPKKRFKLPSFGDAKKRRPVSPAEIASWWINDGGV